MTQKPFEVNKKDFDYKKVYTKFLGRKKVHYYSQVNRAINPNTVKKLIDSILYHKMPTRPVVISYVPSLKKWVLIDGQNLYHTLTFMGLPIPYVEVVTKTVEDAILSMAHHNMAANPWKLMDYINAWKNIRSEYKKLDWYLDKVKAMDTTSVAAVMMDKSVNSTSVTHHLRKGTYKIVDEKKNARYLEELDEYLHIIKSMVVGQDIRSRWLINEYETFRKNLSMYDHKAFIKSLMSDKTLVMFIKSKRISLSERFYENYMRVFENRVVKTF